MSRIILLTVSLGIGLGYFFLPDYVFGYTDNIIDIGLCIMLFFVGIEIGNNKDVLNKIKHIGIRILLIPIMIILGSIMGSLVAGYLLKLPLNEAGAIGSGLGWYTLSSMILAGYSSKISALAFITNITREIIALVIIPIVAKYIGDIESIAPAGATAMDTTLPVISNATNPKTAIISFITGMVLSSSVPILVPIFINIKF